jgi:hypothetical protein
MRIIFSITITIIFFTCSLSIAQDNAMQKEIDRNPFRRNKTELKSPTSPVKNDSKPIEIPNAITVEEPLIIKQPVPLILNDLRSIAIVKNGKRLALFGRRIVAVDEEIEGFKVISISLDKVVLLQGNEELVVKIGDTTKNRERKIKNNPVQNNSNMAEQNWTSIFESLNADSSSVESNNMLNRINQIQSIIKPFLDKTMRNNATSERQR